MLYWLENSILTVINKKRGSCLLTTHKEVFSNVDGVTLFRGLLRLRLC